MGAKKKPVKSKESKSPVEDIKPKQQRTEAQQLLCDISDYLKFKQDKKLPDTFSNKIDSVVEVLKQQIGSPSQASLSLNISPEISSPPMEVQEKNIKQQNIQNQEAKVDNAKSGKQLDQNAKVKTPPPSNKTPPPPNSKTPQGKQKPTVQGAKQQQQNSSQQSVQQKLQNQQVKEQSKQQVDNEYQDQENGVNEIPRPEEQNQNQDEDKGSPTSTNLKIVSPDSNKQQQSLKNQYQQNQEHRQESYYNQQENDEIRQKYQYQKYQSQQKQGKTSPQQENKKKPQQEEIDESALQQPLENLAQSINQIQEDSFSHFRQQTRPNGSSEKVGIALLMLLAGVDSSLVSVINGKVRRD